MVVNMEKDSGSFKMELERELLGDNSLKWVLENCRKILVLSCPST